MSKESVTVTKNKPTEPELALGPDGKPLTFPASRVPEGAVYKPPGLDSGVAVRPAQVNFEPIPIKKIVLRSGVNADFPGKTGARALETGTQSGKTYVLVYEPWARRYVGTYQRADEKPEVFWVHESWVMAYPA